MAAPSKVPYKYPVSLDGVPFMVDTASDLWSQETVPLLRPQSDDSAIQGEQSLNPAGQWRRSWETWHKGAGQASRDRDDSTASRFLSSFGLDIWDRYSIHMLLPTTKKRTSSNTNLMLAPVGDRLFLVDGADVVYTTDITASSPTWTACTNEPGGTILDIATDGKYVWITDGSNSYWALASASPPAFNLGGWTGTQDADVLGYVKGYLLGAHDNTLHYYDAAGAATSITIAAVLPDTFDFVGFAGGPTNSVIYAAGFAGDKSLIFRIGIKDDGSGLDVAIPAGELPDGEIVREVSSYLGFLLLGTDNGVRFATTDSAGDLTIGAELASGSPCYCFEPQGPFVWFGWDNYDGTHGGLGRLSLEEFASADRLAPAYATDLMPSAVGTTTSVVTFQNKRVWTTTGTNLGVYSSGDLPAARTGSVTFSTTDMGFPEDKIAVGVDIQYLCAASGTSISGSVSVDKGVGVTFGDITSGAGVASFALDNLRGSTFDVTLSWNSSSTPWPDVTVYRVTLRVVPAAPSSRIFQVPLVLTAHPDPDGGEDYLDVEAALSDIKTLWATREPVVYEELTESATVSVEDYKWNGRLVRDEVAGFRREGTCLVKLKELT